MIIDSRELYFIFQRVWNFYIRQRRIYVHNITFVILRCYYLLSMLFLSYVKYLLVLVRAFVQERNSGKKKEKETRRYALLKQRKQYNL